VPIDAVVTWMLAGLTAGGLARLVLRAGGYGLIADLLLGLAGSMVGSSILHALVSPRDSGRAASIGIAFIGGTSMIVAQRLWSRSA
jgi:uncharacterized membrane protein YeaQ/YmgE (transglycosylase-associated protein family)